MNVYVKETKYVHVVYKENELAVQMLCYLIYIHDEVKETTKPVTCMNCIAQEGTP